MPVNKKPRKKKTVKTRPAGKTKSAARQKMPPLPDRRAMNEFMASMTGAVREDTVWKAQDKMYDAWEVGQTNKRIALARQALEISPLCAEFCALGLLRL